MKRTLLALAAASVLAFAGVAKAETYNFDPSHTTILFHANHFGFSNPSGRFSIKDGALVLDEKDPKNSVVNVTIDMHSVLTGVPKLDEHLQSPDFFNTAQFPTAVFKSTKVEVTGKDTAKVTGDLTLHGITKPVTLDLKLNKIGVNPISQKKTAGFSGSTTLKRSEFGIDKYVPNVSDDIRLDIEAEANVGQ